MRQLGPKFKKMDFPRINLKRVIELKKESRISMVDITEKKDVIRKAIAEGIITLKKETIQRIRNGQIKKGDVLSTAKLAAINGIKKTSDLIFLAHLILITEIQVSIEINDDESHLKSTVTVKSIGKTGVELEAVMGVMISLLTIFDMCKYLEKNEDGQYETTTISDIRVIEKLKLEGFSK
jgi:cyclic pyranopterin phosphate synthase